MTHDATMISQVACFGGEQRVYRHQSSSTQCEMEFAVFLPKQALQGKACPVLWYLSGLTCTWANVTEKAGAQRYCAEHGLIFVAPDTSPRGENVADDPNQSYDFGLGAGFYVDATQAPFSQHYHMASYVSHELPALLPTLCPIDVDKQGITGHSMGGHGALSLAIKHPEQYKSVSAFAPIVAPSQVPWGQKAFTGYLGDDPSTWLGYDSTALIHAKGWQSDILIDQGEADSFLKEQLQPELFAAACQSAGVPLTLRMQPHYDHSYYFIASFIGEHVAWHAERLR